MDIYQRISHLYESWTAEKQIIGKSFLGRNIYAVKIGYGRPMGIVQYAIHGREYITARLAETHAALGIDMGSCWLIPLTNPDGALLSSRGISSVIDKKQQERLIALNANSKDFSLWKANARGVDLNVNFDADWGCGTKNVRSAGAENYIGSHPFSERETAALRDFTLRLKPDYTLSYHTKGEEIYWRFHQSTRTCLRDKTLAGVISQATGYPLCEAQGSAGGYKDWCIQRLGIPAFTVEVGADTLAHPIREEGLENILLKNGETLQKLSAACSAIL